MKTPIEEQSSFPVELGVVPPVQETAANFSSKDFDDLYNTDLRAKTKKKNGLDYIPWAVSWATLKKKDPLAEFYVERFGENQAPFQFFPGMGYMVWTYITVNGHTQCMQYPVIDHKNKAIIENVTVFDINTAIVRCLAKNAALFGVGLYVYEGIDDMPEAVLETERLIDECMELVRKKCELSAAAKEKVSEICKAVDPDANGDPRLISDVEKLKLLKKKLMGVRK